MVVDWKHETKIFPPSCIARGMPWAVHMDGIRMAGSSHLARSAARKKIRAANPHTAAVPSRRPCSLAPQSGYGLSSRPSEVRTSRNVPCNVWTVTSPIKVKHSWALTISKRLYQIYVLLNRKLKFCTRPEFLLNEKLI